MTPALLLLDWLAFTPKGALRPSMAPTWLVFPLGFGVYSLARGPIAGFYPYPFLDVSDLGYARVLANMGVMSALFLVVGLGFVLLNRLLGRRA